MRGVWADRPKLLHLGVFFIAYVLGCGFAQLLAIIPGTGISVWPPSGIFIATLMSAPKRSWLWWVVAGCLAEMLGNAIWFGSPLPAALLIYSGNALEAIVAALLINRVCKPPVRLETRHEVLAIVVIGAGLAPVFAATVGAATVSAFGMLSQSFTGAWPLFWIGDATGVLIVAPLTLVVIHNWRDRSWLSPARWMEACILGLIFLGVAALSLSNYLPFAYLIMPPLLWTAVRFEFKGAAVSLILLALTAAVFTAAGASQFVGDLVSQREKHIMLQLFLAVSAFSALIVAAISREHQQAVLTARRSERSLRALIETLPAQIWCTSAEGEPIYFSRQFRDFIGFDVADIQTDGASRLSDLLIRVIHPEDLDTVNTLFSQSLATGAFYALKHRVRRADGAYRWFEIRAQPMRDSNGNIVQWNGVCLDIDDQVLAEDTLRSTSDRLARATQVASLAELSAAIAHEVNQPLAAIVTNAAVLKRWLSAEPPNIARATITSERITRDANTAADVVGRIRALFQHAPGTRAPEDLNRLIGEVCKLMADKISAQNIRIERDLEPDLPAVALDRVQVQQVLVNLIRNGIEAMDAVPEPTRVLKIRSRRGGCSEIRVEVRDAGMGFQSADRAFDPFFTTKESGMGMGLAISRSIIEAHGGRLWATNNETTGATVAFTVRLTHE